MVFMMKSCTSATMCCNTSECGKIHDKALQALKPAAGVETNVTAQRQRT